MSLFRDYNGRIDAFNVIMVPVLAVLVIALIGMIGSLVVDGVQGYRAQPAAIACEAQGLESARRTFTTTVTCVPVPGHSVDTLIIRQ